MTLGIIIPYFENSTQAKERMEYLIDTLSHQINNETDILVIDDGSNALWLDEYYFLNIIHLNANKGVSYARNVGLDYLLDKCDYIGFIDADDSVSNDYIREALKVCERGYDYIDTRFVQDGIEVFGTKKAEEKRKNVIKCGVAACFFKSSVIGDNRFDENLQIGEDSKFSYKVIDLKKHKKGLSKGIYIYNKWVNPESLTCKYAKNEISKEK